MKLRIHLADLPGTVKHPSVVRVTIDRFFQEVVKKSTVFKSLEVEWWTRKHRGGNPPAASGNFVVYFVADPGDTLVASPVGLSGQGANHLAGHTRFDSRTAGSEVYIDSARNDGRLMGLVAIHELMHHASHQGNGIHSLQTAGGEPTSIVRGTIAPGMNWKAGDVAFMVQHLDNQTARRNRRSWTNGFVKYHDPARLARFGQQGI